jgi:hypothetical protein
LAQLVGQVVAPQYDSVAGAADVLGAGRALGHGTERVLVELALVVKDVCKNVSHV